MATVVCNFFMARRNNVIPYTCLKGYKECTFGECPDYKPSETMTQEDADWVDSIIAELGSNFFVMSPDEISDYVARRWYEEKGIP